MMSSVDISSSSAGASSSQRTATGNPANPHPVQHPQSRHSTFSGQPQRTGSPTPHPQMLNRQSYGGGGGGAPPGAEAGRLKTEQVVLEFLYKVTELVLQSRVHLHTDASQRQTPTARRARFNLDIEDIQDIRDSMGDWREDVHLPLTVDVFWDGDGGQRVLLERWIVVYTNGLSAVTNQFDALDFHGRRHSSIGIGGSARSYATAGNTRDVIQILKEVLKKFTVLLRALHSFMRLLPAHRFFRQSYPSTLSYEIHSCEDTQLPSGFDPGIATNQYSFMPINTPFGFVKLSTLYRRDCSALERRRKRVSNEIFQENFIIQDYVPASPELVPASGSSRRQSPSLSPSPPMMMPPASIPSSPRRTSDAGDAVDLRQRSNPEVIPDDDQGRATPRRTVQQSFSQPMPIPQQAKSPVSVSFDERTDATTSAEEMPTKPVAIQQHPHSYGEPGRLRALSANPNVTAAPYGYGNVAVERSQTPPTGLLASSSGFSGGGGSFQESHLTSPHHHPLSTPPRHPNSLLTPRMSGRTSFISSTSSSAIGKKSNNEYAYRASLENFSLDTSGPHHGQSHMSPNQSPSASPSLGSADRGHTFHFGGARRSGSFDSQRSVTPELPSSGLGNSSGSGGGGSRLSSGTSPHLTPPFMADSPPTSAGNQSGSAHADPSSAAALVPRRTSLDQSPTLTGTPVLTSSPPFQANPSELLSTSPGYSHSKHFQTLRRGGAPTFMSTDAAFGRSGSFHVAGGSALSGGGSILAAGPSFGSGLSNNALVDSKERPFSTDFHENSAGIWGISPDSPDKFAISIGASTRRRFLSAGANIGGEAVNEDASDFSRAYGGGPTDSDMLLLPFALGDDTENLSIGTTITTSSSGGERPSSLNFPDTSSDSQLRSGAAGNMAWDTASVGSFLQQLNNAPRLQTFETSSTTSDDQRASVTAEERASLSDTQGDTASAPRLPSSATPSYFDDELESFRNLRNELSQAL